MYKWYMKYHLIIDPEFQRLIPPLSAKEREILEENILRDGCREPLVIWNDIILDGHNRYEICRQHSLPFEVKDVTLESRDEAVAWICANQMGRRNITEETRRYLIGKRFEVEKRIGARNATGINQYSDSEVSPTIWGKPKNNETKYGISARIGNEYNISHATVEKYGRYARAVDRIGSVDAHVVPYILSGVVHLGQDNAYDMTQLTDKQITAVTSDIPPNCHYHLDRDRIIESLKKSRQKSPEHTQMPEFSTQSIKDMPSYDPDAEVSSLTLTIPSWRTSIERVQAASNMMAVSTSAKASLRRELESLMRTVEKMLDRVEEA